jgi:hypothetical protein
VGLSGFGLLPTPGSVPCTLCSSPQASSTTQDMFHIVLDVVYMWMAAERTGSCGLPPGTQPQKPTHTAPQGFKTGAGHWHTRAAPNAAVGTSASTPHGITAPRPLRYTVLLTERPCNSLHGAPSATKTAIHSQHIQKECAHKVVHPPHDAFGLDMTSPRIE